MRELPADLAMALRQLEETAAEARTQAIRATAEPRPTVTLPDAKAVEAAATKPDAPAELTAVAKAVKDGKVTWDDVAAGRGGEVPEVRAAYEANRRMVVAALLSEPEPPKPASTPEPATDEPVTVTVTEDWTVEPRTPPPPADEGSGDAPPERGRATRPDDDEVRVYVRKDL